MTRTQAQKTGRKLVRHTHDGMLCGACLQPLVRGALVAEQGGRRYHTTCKIPDKTLSDRLHAHGARVLGKRR